MSCIQHRRRNPEVETGVGPSSATASTEKQMVRRNKQMEWQVAAGPANSKKWGIC